MLTILSDPWPKKQQFFKNNDKRAAYLNDIQ